MCSFMTCYVSFCYVRCHVWSSVLVFFLFFKQKTAYEMRISDWSSDVCSSDLQRRPARAAALGHGALGGGPRQGASGHGASGHGASGHGADLRGAAIGRASCRERVCPYV